MNAQSIFTIPIHKGWKSIMGMAIFLMVLLYSCPVDTEDTSMQIPSPDPSVLYKADMDENTQSLFSKGDVDNPYLFTFEISNVRLLEDISGEIIIVGANNNILYEQRGLTLSLFSYLKGTTIKNHKNLKNMYVLTPGELNRIDAQYTVQAEDDDDTYAYIVGIGPSENAPIPYEALTDTFTILARIIYEGQVFKETSAKVSRTADQYSIYTWRDLQHVNDDLTGHYEVKNDIIFPTAGHYGYKNFVPIGKVGKAMKSFSGVFEGNNYDIEGVRIDYASENQIGLFRRVRGGTVRNVNLYHNEIVGRNSVGGLVGFVHFGSVIENCHVYALNGARVRSSSDSGSYIGGLIGKMSTSSEDSLVVSDSSADTDVEGGEYVGGLIGYANGEVRNSYAVGNVYGKTTVGGLIGWIGEISNKMSQAIGVYATGNVKGTSIVGGLMGHVKASKVIGYATGDVVGSSDNVGGLAGKLVATTLFGYATGQVEGRNNVGGVAGEASWTWHWYNYEPQDVVIHAYSLSNIIGYRQVGGIVGYIAPYQNVTPDGSTGTTSITGYARGALQVDGAGMNSAGLVVGKFSNAQEYDVAGYFPGTTNNAILLSHFRRGINGEEIVIVEVNDDNYQSKFEGLTFGENTGQWTWVNKGEWPAINIGDVAAASAQPIAESAYTEAPSLLHPDNLYNKQTDKSLRGIEQLEENVFRVYEMHSANYEKRRMNNRMLQADFYPTGLYVKPKETITVTVASDTALNNLRILTGTYSRYAEAPNPDRFVLKRGKNTITNNRNVPRLIYIQFTTEQAKLDDIASVTIEGAFKVPYFIRGKTTNKAFQSMLNNYEYENILLVSDKAMMVISKAEALKVKNQNWEKTVELLHKVVKVSEYIQGLDNESYYDMSPATRILMTEREGGGPMSATYYRVSVPRWGILQWADNNKIPISWGLWHEVGHMYEFAPILIGETTVNIYSLAVERAFNQRSRLIRENRWKGIKSYLAKPAAEKKFNDINVFMKLGMLQQLWLGYGNTNEERDKFFINLHKNIRRESKHVDNTITATLSYLMVKASEVYGYNLNDFFKKWGFQVPQEAFDAVDALGLEKLPRDLTTLGG